MKKKKDFNAHIAEHNGIIKRMTDEIKKVIVGQDAIIEKALIGLFSKGHIIIEGMPGLAKTLLLKTLSQIIHASFNRIQFTPDLLPADLIGTRIYDRRTGKFYTRKGPIFANLILADEINRAPAKVQSALLEAMEEKQVTIGDETFKLDEPFMVMATQNPIESEGTYRLPEAQVDRFMLKIKIGYPSFDDENEIINRMAGGKVIKVKTITTPDEILKIREVVDSIYVDELIKKYILNIVFTTRKMGNNGVGIEEHIEYGASPRASIYLTTTAKAHAFINSRSHVMPEDVAATAFEVLRHRIILTYEAEAEGVTTDELIKRLFEKVEVP
ncbi:MAG: MoxR family ATPase [Nitrospirae bacterium]|nr:MoxR family ATPase [Nitrospirota bacterium]